MITTTRTTVGGI